MSLEHLHTCIITSLVLPATLWGTPCVGRQGTCHVLEPTLQMRTLTRAKGPGSNTCSLPRLGSPQLPGYLSWHRGALTTVRGGRPSLSHACRIWSPSSGILYGLAQPAGRADQGVCSGTPPARESLVGPGARGLSLRRLTLVQIRAGVHVCAGRAFWKHPEGRLPGQGGSDLC